MAELLNKVREHYKSLTPLSSTLIKFYIPVLTAFGHRIGSGRINLSFYRFDHSL